MRGPAGNRSLFPRGTCLPQAASIHLPRRQWQRFCQVCNILTPSPAVVATFLPGMHHPHTFPGGSGNVFARYAISLHLPPRQWRRFCQVCNTLHLPRRQRQLFARYATSLHLPQRQQQRFVRFSTSLHLPRRQRQRFCQVCNIPKPSPAAVATFCQVCNISTPSPAAAATFLSCMQQMI